MRAFGTVGARGEGFNVSCTRDDVAAFKRVWPASGLPGNSVTFCFGSNGDLVGILPTRMAARWDGPAAVALSQDAQCYGARRLRRNDAHAPNCRCTEGAR